MNKFIKPPKEDFAEYYNTHTGIETAIHFSIARPTVSKYAREYNIPRRSFKYKELPSVFTPRQIEIINGSLLGDACLEKLETSKCNSRFIEKHGIQQLEYLQWKFKELKPFTQTIGYGEEIKDDKTYQYCKFNTFNCPCFTFLESKWYKQRIKIVPNDLILTPLTLAVWYFDDGYFCKDQKNITIYTNGFSLKEVKKLVKKLHKLGIKNCHMRQSQESRGSKPEIYIEKPSCERFFNIIQSHIDFIKCMKYKLER